MSAAKFSPSFGKEVETMSRIGRKPIEIDKDFLKTVHTQWYKNEITTAHAVKLLGLSRNTFYRRMWEYEEENGIPQKNGKRGE